MPTIELAPPRSRSSSSFPVQTCRRTRSGTASVRSFTVVLIGTGPFLSPRFEQPLAGSIPPGSRAALSRCPTAPAAVVEPSLVCTRRLSKSTPPPDAITVELLAVRYAAVFRGRSHSANSWTNGGLGAGCTAGSARPSASSRSSAPGRRAVSAVTPRWPFRIAVIRFTGTSRAFDSALADKGLTL